MLDSGLGGLTVVKALQNALPHEDILYFGDTARVPYGSKSVATVSDFVRQIIAYLQPFEPKHVVLACNTATALTLSAVRSEFPSLSISGVIEPGARAAIEAATAGAGIVVEGRDIGSVVWPDAPVKVYLSADSSARASRRAAEEGGSDVSATEESLLARDRIDSGRTASPLVMAEDAVHIDTTGYTLDEVIERVVALVEQLDSVGSGT